MVHGETLRNGADWVCPDCNTRVTIKVLSSQAGYFVGSVCACPWCIVYTRESGYYANEEEAQQALDTGDYYRGDTPDGATDRLFAALRRPSDAK